MSGVGCRVESTRFIGDERLGVGPGFGGWRLRMRDRDWARVWGSESGDGRVRVGPGLGDKRAGFGTSETRRAKGLGLKFRVWGLLGMRDCGLGQALGVRG